jgi:hypothetical protein
VVPGKKMGFSSMDAADAVRRSIKLLDIGYSTGA